MLKIIKAYTPVRILLIACVETPNIISVRKQLYSY